MDASVRMFFIMVIDDVAPCWTGLGHSYSRRLREALLRYRLVFRSFGLSTLKGGPPAASELPMFLICRQAHVHLQNLKDCKFSLLTCLWRVAAKPLRLRCI